MSSLGTGRERDRAFAEWQAATLDPRVSDAECEELRRAFLSADSIHEDYLQSERDDARAERDSE